MSKPKKIQEYAVLWLNSQGMSVDDMMKEIELSKRQINSILKKYHNTQSQLETKVDQTIKTNHHNTKNLMIMDSGAKKFRVAIMTKDASMAHDAILKNLPDQPNQSNFIYRQNNG